MLKFERKLSDQSFILNLEMATHPLTENFPQERGMVILLTEVEDMTLQWEALLYINISTLQSGFQRWFQRWSVG